MLWYLPTFLYKKLYPAFYIYKPVFPRGSVVVVSKSSISMTISKFMEHLSSPPIFSGVDITRSLILCVCFVDRCLSFFFWSLFSLSFDSRILITPLVSSNSPYEQNNHVGKKTTLTDMDI